MSQLDFTPPPSRPLLQLQALESPHGSETGGSTDELPDFDTDDGILDSPVGFQWSELSSWEEISRGEGLDGMGN
jgi:hypothetical protein